MNNENIKTYKNLHLLPVQNAVLNDNRNKSGIYLWRNLLNKKTYIGSSTSLSKRFLKYFNDNALVKNRMLINLAILKHKRINFCLEIIEYCSVEDLITREQFYLDTLKPEYNILKIAGSSFGYTHTNAALVKMNSRTASEATLLRMKNRVQTAETIDKISVSNGTPVKIINIITNKVMMYPSKKKAGLALGVSDSTIGRHLRSKKELLNKYHVLDIDA